MADLIDRQAAIDAMNGIINMFEQILRDIRESKVDDSVCGMCEYDGAYIGQSGDWYNECPGFNKDDCFKLSDECRKRWLKSADVPSVRPEPDHFREANKMIWHECDPDDPSSFPDDDRAVLVSFPDSPIPAVGWFERNNDFYGWTDGDQFGMHVDGWWELPKKPERE